jgi:acyl-CoA synthetase (NDP forming)/RimJ/RimL family protein N-acetyltransferase
VDTPSTDPGQEPNGEPAPVRYPTHWETHAVLKDGSTVEVRPIRPDDRALFSRFHSRQSQESIYFRYFQYRPELTERELDHLTQVDYLDRMAFVALLGQELVAVARYEKLKDRPRAEVAFFVDDAHHGKGIGTLMLEYLAAAGRDRQLEGFTASVLPENYRMLGVFRSAGFEVATRFEAGIIEVELGIELTAETSSVIADRQRRSTARSVARVLEPTSVAVIGASRTPGTVGYNLVRNLVEAAGVGPGEQLVRILPVNPQADGIAGVPAYPTIADAAAALQVGRPDDSDGNEAAGIDLAVVAVRAELVEQIVDQCVAAEVKSLLIVSAGFSELDEEGRLRERRLVETARDNGMRMIGPNAFGVINTDPERSVGAVFNQIRRVPGVVALGSESGPLATAVLERMRGTGLGLSSFVGIGNRADVSVNDLIDYWDVDERTEVIVLYVENFGNLANFATVARRTSLTKPIITIRPSSADVSDLLEQVGVILVDEVSQLAEQSLLAATQPPALGNRVTVISNTSSLARLATEACRRSGLDVVVPASVADVAVDDSVLIGNLDSVLLMPSSDTDEYERYVVAASVSDEVDLVLIALAPTEFLPIAALERVLHRVNRAIDKPMAAIGLVGPDQLSVDRLPIYTFPEEAAQVLGRHARWGQWRRARTGEAPAAASAPEGEAAVDAVLAGRDEVHLTLASPDIGPLLGELGIPLAPFGTARGLDEAVAVAERVGYPVAMKAANLANRSLGEAGGAAIDLHDRDALVNAHRRMSEQFEVEMKTVVVQRMVPSSRTVRLEVLQDQSFGSMVSIGLGGAGFRGSPPLARRFLPIERGDATELVEALVEESGIAGLDQATRTALIELALVLGRAATVSPQVHHIALDPVLLAGEETIATDADIVLRRAAPDVLAEVRHI